MNVFDLELTVNALEGDRRVLLQESYSDLPEVRETDRICFTFKITSRCGEPKLFLQDHPLDVYISEKTNLYTRYSTVIDYFLLNSFGVSSVAISVEGADEFYRFTPINVVATKINKEQAERTLAYLSGKMEDITRLCFSKTQVGSDTSEPGHTDTLTKIDFSRRVLESIHSMRQRFVMQPCKRTIESLKVTRYEDNSHITEKEIAWLFQHLDHLYPTQPDTSKVTIQCRHYSIERIQRTTLKIETNVFENQVVYSFLINVRKFLQSIPASIIPDVAQSTYTGYYTLDSVLKTISLPLLERRHKEASSLLRQCNELVTFFEKNLPSDYKGVLRPRLTVKAKRYSHYERHFRLIEEWYGLGEPKWKGHDYLFGLKSLDKLYEFLCLYLIMDSLSDLGFRVVESDIRMPDRTRGISGLSVDIDSGIINNYYRFDRGAFKLELFYEPTIWSYSENSVLGELVDTYHPGKSFRSCWTPDFLLRTSHEGKERFYIFDAKYSNHQNTKQQHLPAIIEKYFMKIRKLDRLGKLEENHPVSLVYALIPKTTLDHYHFHGGPFNIFDQYAAPPYFGYTKLNVDHRLPLLKLLECVLRLPAKDNLIDLEALKNRHL